ncbi:MAG TPA: glucose-6-phosphate dehydrogenase assembly protein OpcA [Candidatus Solibacter sp.]|nr:glucose-6-phosphate dehydrogenase assembly protein OpcA [Candidatus Solibacter sp.]
MSTTVSPEKILKELAALWVEEGKQGGAGVLRACSMTLIVIAEESEDSVAIGETIASLMPEHPARAILVRLLPGNERALSEHVYQQCWRPFGQRQQICCEQIELSASDAALGDLPSVLLPLVVSDLPVILWCRSPRLIQMAEFEDLARLATRVVVDSAAFADAKQAMARLVQEQSRGLWVADLTWTRLTRWREMLARTFENREYLARLQQIEHVAVSFGPKYETAARYMGAWAHDTLAGVNVKTGLTVSKGAYSLSVELKGEAFRVALACEGGTLLVTVNDLANRSSLGKISDAQLMREELAIMKRDLIFERTLSSAARIAVSSSSE